MRIEGNTTPIDKMRRVAAHMTTMYTKFDLTFARTPYSSSDLLEIVAPLLAANSLTSLVFIMTGVDSHFVQALHQHICDKRTSSLEAVAFNKEEGLGDVGAVNTLMALRSAPNLRTLNFMFCGITNRGAEILHGMLEAFPGLCHITVWEHEDIPNAPRGLVRIQNRCRCL